MANNENYQNNINDNESKEEKAKKALSDDIFNFVVKACQEFKIQLFITTHSIEAVDGILSTQRYDDDTTENDLIRVITFRKRDNRTFSRVLNGKQAYEDRKNYGLEVRI